MRHSKFGVNPVRCLKLRSLLAASAEILSLL
jgi:hypothetical protein